MAVTKRTRYEVLRRDNHTCRYCGGQAPDVVLTVDHVVPVALGGGDDPGNLVAACRDCNAGKSASSPDAPLVESVAQDALRWSAAMRAAAASAVADIRAAGQYREGFLAEWKSWSYGWKEHEYPLPHGWESSVDRWGAAGLPAELLNEAIRVAMGGPAGVDDKFRYCAGVAIRQLRNLAERAATAAGGTPESAASGEPCGHCAVCRTPERFNPGTHCLILDSDPHPDMPTCPVCGLRSCLYAAGHDDGYYVGARDAMPASERRGWTQARYWQMDPLELLRIPKGPIPTYIPEDPWAVL